MLGTSVVVLVTPLSKVWFTSTTTSTRTAWFDNWGKGVAEETKLGTTASTKTTLGTGLVVARLEGTSVENFRPLESVVSDGTIVTTMRGMFEEVIEAV